MNFLISQGVYYALILNAIAFVSANSTDISYDNNSLTRVIVNRINPKDYLAKNRPMLLDKASQEFSSKNKSFIVQRSIDGDVEYQDSRY